jgi:Transposase
MQIRSVGIDLGKTTFHLVALGDNGKVLLKKKFSQKQLIAFTANMQTSLIGMEACSGAHFLGRALRGQGHDVRLIAAQFVKPFVKSNKNDFLDAEANVDAEVLSEAPRISKDFHNSSHISRHLLCRPRSISSLPVFAHFLTMSGKDHFDSCCPANVASLNSTTFARPLALNCLSWAT